MSRILRRPMFSGGPVDSYGTGIASGLADGGMPPKRGLVDGPGGYAGKPQGKIPTKTFNKKIFAPWDLGTYGDGQRKRGGAGAMYQGVGGPMWTGSEIMNFQKSFPKSNVTFADSLMPTKKYSYEATTNPDLLAIMQNMMDKDMPLLDPDKSPEENTTVDIQDIYESNIDDSASKSKTMTMKQAEMNQGNIMPGVEVNTGEVVVEDANESGIEEMADRYFELMGGKKARVQDMSDWALKFFANTQKEGATVGAAAGETADWITSKPSRTETMKDAATKFAINRDMQMEMLDKKIESSESIAEKNLLAQIKRDLNKTYAPGITEKDIKYGSGLKKGSSEHTLYLKKQDLAPTLADEINKRKIEKDSTGIGSLMSTSEANALGSLYYDDWQGIFDAETSKDDGTYLDTADNLIITFKNGELVSSQQIAELI